MSEEYLKYIKEGLFDSVEFSLLEKVTADKANISDFRFKFGNILDEFKLKNKNLLLVALDEVITNIAEHGLKFDNEKQVTVAIFVSMPMVVIVLEDDGEPFDPRKKRAKSPKRQFAKGADGGYGMYIYKRVFYEIDYSSEKNKNHMVLYFNDEKVKVPA